MNNTLSKNKGGSTVFEIIIAITLITFILFFPVIAFSLMHKKNLLADTLALGLQTVSVEGGLTDRTEHVLLENLSAKGLLPESPTHPLRQRIRFESNADARGGQTQNLVYKDGPAPKISFTIWYPADTEVSFINRLSRLIGVNNQGAAFQTNVAGETVWYYRMGGYIFSEKIENGTIVALPPLPPLIVLPDAIITMNPLTDILSTTNITFMHNTESNGVAIIGAEWQVNSEAIVIASSLSRTFPAGNHVVRLRVQNTEGVWSNWAFQTFAVQSIPDAVITMTPNTNITTATNVIFTHNATSNGVAITSVEWQLNNGAITTTPPNGMLSAGSHTIRLRVQNANGAWSDWVSQAFTVNSIPVAVLTMTPNTNLDTTTNIVFTHNTTSGGQNITAAEWQRNSDAITTAPPNGTFSAGNHAVRLRVRNASGVWSDWTLVVFNIEPSLLFYYNPRSWNHIINLARWRIEGNVTMGSGGNIIVGRTFFGARGLLETREMFSVPSAGRTLNIVFSGRIQTAEGAPGGTWAQILEDAHRFSFGDIGIIHLSPWHYLYFSTGVLRPWPNHVRITPCLRGMDVEYRIEITTNQARFFVDDILQTTLNHSLTGSHPIVFLNNGTWGASWFEINSLRVESQ